MSIRQVQFGEKTRLSDSWWNEELLWVLGSTRPNTSLLDPMKRLVYLQDIFDQPQWELTLIPWSTDPIWTQQFRRGRRTFSRQKSLLLGSTTSIHLHLWFETSHFLFNFSGRLCRGLTRRSPAIKSLVKMLFTTFDLTSVKIDLLIEEIMGSIA